MLSLIRSISVQLLEKDISRIIGNFRRLQSSSVNVASDSTAEYSSTDSTVEKDDSTTRQTSIGRAAWKENVIEQPVAMTPAYLEEHYREHREGGFYYDHRIIVPEMPEKYTVKPFKTIKTGGNHPDTGRKEFRRVGGGLKKTWLWVDTKRQGPASGPPLIERVVRIINSDCHSAKVALVGCGNTLHYIFATENLKVGDLIKTSSEIPKNPVGALPAGTMVCCVEDYPGWGAKYAMNAGTYAILMKHIDNRCIVQLPTKHEISIDEKCMVTVGRMSNIEHNQFIRGKAGVSRLMGIRPKLGLFHLKTGRFGRRPFRPKPILVITGEKPDWPNVIKLQSPDLNFYE
ncbi:unnamed protein product [Didymodactylos carnosus]|uniref:Ribosomal protein L2 n=1 Tax=Didymodactylos carnosus TaxID=1234261 RepID=A0A814E594_9BILA|nr:unnamed protein product [Didymodactylos carnosus]CAF1020173.1 unnamed protein product [Didymodactylos carnosus]CAF3737131.1 unnamed protein product [Didymodactylos carnosus]CAF3788810.1 unnamed protein product [Didymodactylos carnosus]